MNLFVKIIATQNNLHSYAGENNFIDQNTSKHQVVK